MTRWASDGARQTAYNVRARTIASLVALGITCAPFLAYGQSDGGVVLDAPRILHMPSGHYDFNPAAFKVVDGELKRLQQLERVHLMEPAWHLPVIIGAVVGLVVGTLTGLAINWLWEKLAEAAKPPSP